MTTRPNSKPKPTKLEEYTISGPSAVYSRSIQLLRGPSGRPQRLCLFLDGELYWREMKAIPVLQAIIDRGTPPPTTFAFISHGSQKDREHDYTCNDQFGSFISETVIPWLQSEIPGLQPGQHLIGGLSLSGLMSPYLALKYPDHFRCCLSQSGSFWWKDEHFTKTAQQFAPAKTRIWLSVGNQETEVDEPAPGSLPEVSQVVGVKHAHEVLKTLGATVHYHEYHGGHSLEHWRDELDQALHWLLTGKYD